jgi:ornithine cyclodeaminase/alanine dehydrogenase-like protein (mu-crystallin family)
MTSLPPAGALAIRVWIEPGADPSFRARITRTLDVAGADTVVTATATTEEVSVIVAEWLGDYLAATVRADRPE